MPTHSGKFSVSSAWQILRHRTDPNQEFKSMWIKGLPFKISFFLWRLWRKKIATDDIWRRQGQMVMSRCLCCQQPQEESIEHIFITSPTASKLKLLFQAVPAIITWELWKRINTGKHGGLVSTNRAIHEINRTLHQLAMVSFLVMVGTNAKGNPGPSSLGFCVRNDKGDVVYERAVDLGAEAKAILQGLEYYVEHDLHPLILEADSLVMKKVIEGYFRVSLIL
uniref:Uncharacterized protein LOC104223745 n=1 Tax=Nicotiana sylvestris TaxID=4096 RepID=A0A1U7W8L8_NICSY|nr:PREDICTED: uncharacterized protein LOC104223745 [Nicotiana sylvestris]